MLMLIDANSLAIGTDPIVFASARSASLQLDNAPSAGAQQTVSLWQTNSRAILASREIALKFFATAPPRSSN
jgi:hypothetical protein